MLNVNLTRLLKTKYEQVHIACILRSLCSCNRWSRRHYVFELSVRLCVRACVCRCTGGGIHRPACRRLVVKPSFLCIPPKELQRHQYVLNTCKKPVKKVRFILPPLVDWLVWFFTRKLEDECKNVPEILQGYVDLGTVKRLWRRSESRYPGNFVVHLSTGPVQILKSHEMKMLPIVGSCFGQP